MKKYILGLLFLAISLASFLHAQSASKTLNNIINKYEQLHNYTMGFSFIFTDFQGYTVEYEGDLFAAKNKYQIDSKETRQIYNGKKLYSIDKESKEVTISTLDESSSEHLSPTTLISSFRKDYDATLSLKNGDKTLILKPKEDSYILEATIFANAQDEIQQFLVKNVDGSRYKIEVKRYLENLIIPGSIFKFNKKSYPGYIITDLD